MKKFVGRVIADGELTGEAIVSKGGVNTLATFQKSALKNAKTVICSDQNNPDLYNKELTGKILCLPKTIGSLQADWLFRLSAQWVSTLAQCYLAKVSIALPHLA